MHHAAPRRTISGVVRYLWASPASCVGLVLAVAARLTGARARLVDGVLEVAGGGIAHAVAWLPRSMRFSAITFGHVVIGLDHSTLARCRVHERVHVAQYERWGALFLLLYPASSVIQLLCGRDPYRDNVFEREAFAREKYLA